MDLELAGDALGCLGHLGVAEHGLVCGVFRDQREHRHQVRFAGAVVANDEHALVVDGDVERELRDHHLGEALRHLVGDDIGRDELLSLVRAIGVEQLDDRLDRLELDEISVAHAMLALLWYWTSSLDGKRDRAIEGVVSVLGMARFGVGQARPAASLPILSRPNCHDAACMGLPL